MGTHEILTILQRLDQIDQRLAALEGRINNLSNRFTKDGVLDGLGPNSMLTAQEVASIMRVTYRTVQRWIDDRKIVFIKLPGGDLRIKKVNLDGWIEKRMIK